MNGEIREGKLSSGAGNVSLAADDILLLGTAAVILALPMLIHGPMVTGHDTFQHLNFSRNFSAQFWGGELYPRWLLDMNHGLGSPSLFVYPPFASYVYALLEPLGRVFHFNSFNVGEFLALFGSGVAAFLWLRTLANRNAALICAVLYMLMPYHLAIDFYRRTALSECWALVWMPLVLYFAAQATSRKRFALLGVAITYALLILSHLVSVAIFSIIPLAVALLLSPRAERISSTLRVATGMALGVGLSFFYFLPALSHSKNFPVVRQLGPASTALPGNFIELGDLNLGQPGIGFVHWVSLSAMSTIVLMSICALVVFLEGQPQLRRKVVFWIAVCVLPVFLMLSASFGAWIRLPRLFMALQYPWRLNIVLCVAALFIGAAYLSEFSRFSRASRMLSLTFAIPIILVWFLSYGAVWHRYNTEVFIPSAKNLVNDDDGWFYAWSVSDLDQASALHASTGPRVRFLGVAGTADVLLWKARNIEFRTDSSTGGPVRINQFYYPSWRATLVQSARPLEVKASMPEGLLEVEVPPGTQEVVVEIPTSAAERAGGWISALCVLLFAFLAWWPGAGNSSATDKPLGQAKPSL